MEKCSPLDEAHESQKEELYAEYLRLWRVFRQERGKYGYNSFYTREAQRELLEAWDRYEAVAFPKRQREQSPSSE